MGLTVLIMLQMARWPTDFLNNYTEPMLQLGPHNNELLISHSDNTFDKKKIRGPDSAVFKITQFQLADFIKNKQLIDFYENA